MWSASTSSWSWYHYDARGSVTHLTNASGQVVEQYSYSAFGIPSYYNGSGSQLGASAFNNRFLFQGRDWIKELSLYDYRNRMYHPGTGRFLQPDPLSLDAGDPNIYRYCNNDPINGSDPLGLGDPISIGTLTYGDGSLYSASSEAYYNAIFGSAPSSTSIFSFTSSSNFGFGSSFADYGLPLLAQLLGGQGRGIRLPASDAGGGGGSAGTTGQIKVDPQLDSAARALGPLLIAISQTNSDHSPKGTGWERGNTIGLVNGRPQEGEMNVASGGTRFKGPQIILWPDAPKNSSEFVFVHAHTTTDRDQAHHTLTSPADRLGANQTHSAIYTFAADGRGGYLAERYRPSASRPDRIKGINGVTEQFSNSVWFRISD